MWKRFIDWLFPRCPSGLGHRARISIVTNINGNKFCWHRDCFKANFADCKRTHPEAMK